MRKFAAILLLIIFLFNLVGYRFLFNYAQQKSDVQLEASLDNNQYNNADLIEIKVPLSMPYQVLQSDWERVDGEINVKGKIYKYVKRRIVDGEMVLKCLPDANKMRIQNAKDNFFKDTNDIAQNNTSKKPGSSKAEFFKNLTGDYDGQVNSYAIASLPVISSLQASSQNEALSSIPHAPLVPPPNVI